MYTLYKVLWTSVAHLVPEIGRIRRHYRSQDMKRRREDDADEINDDGDEGGTEEAEPQPPGTSGFECGLLTNLPFSCVLDMAASRWSDQIDID